MGRRTVQEAHRLEADLRARLSVREYHTLIRQLEGAVAGIDVLRNKAPDFLNHFLEDVRLVSTDSISDQARAALTGLMDELRTAEHRRSASQPRRRLNLVGK